jgi:sulfate adenylyltransferase
MTSCALTDSRELIAPYGNRLVDLLVDEVRAQELKREAIDLPSIELNRRQLCDLELLLNGGLSPLKRFMDRSDYESVLNEMRLADDTFWPMPVCLDVSAEVATSLSVGQRVALRELEGTLLAILTVDDLWKVDKQCEAELVYGTTSPTHRGVDYLMNHAGTHYLGGTLEGLALPVHYDYVDLRLAPAALRKSFVQRGWARVAAFQACYPLAPEDYEFAWGIARECNAQLLVHPVVGMAKLDDAQHYRRVRAYQALTVPTPDTTLLALSPLALRMAGPRETLCQAIVQRNYGCTHLLIGATHHGSHSSLTCPEYYSSQALQSLFSQYSEILGIKILALPHRTVSELAAEVVQQDQALEVAKVLKLASATRRRATIAHHHSGTLSLTPEARPQGFTVFFTGLSGAGKSTLAKALMARLLELGDQCVTLLDGDIVRKHLSGELGFSKEHRDINVRRIGYVASEITKHGGIAVCAPIAPYQGTRAYVREMVEAFGKFIEVYVATPIQVCESRDCKGLYAKARAGVIKDFTGVSDPYEVPEAPEVAVDTSKGAVHEVVEQILLVLQQEGLIDAGHYVSQAL